MIYDAMSVVILAVICGTLAAIVYSLRVLVIMERRIARMDAHIEVITRRIAKEEMKVEKDEAIVMQALNIDKVKRAAKSSSQKK